MESGEVASFASRKVYIRGSNALENVATGRACTVPVIQHQYFAKDASHATLQKFLIRNLIQPVVLGRQMCDI